MKLKKFKGNPVLSPNPGNDWENLVVCNPGAWYEDGKFYLLYRAAGDDEDHVIRFGLAVSTDGFHFERVSDKPVFGMNDEEREQFNLSGTEFQHSQVQNALERCSWSCARSKV